MAPPGVLSVHDGAQSSSCWHCGRRPSLKCTLLGRWSSAVLTRGPTHISRLTFRRLQVFCAPVLVPRFPHIHLLQPLGG